MYDFLASLYYIRLVVIVGSTQFYDYHLAEEMTHFKNEMNWTTAGRKVMRDMQGVANIINGVSLISKQLTGKGCFPYSVELPCSYDFHSQKPTSVLKNPSMDEPNS